VSIRELCDAAEVTWGALEDRRDMLALLAAVAVGTGQKGLKGYRPASLVLAEKLAEEPEAPLDRHTEVLRFVTKAGGEG